MDKREKFEVVEAWEIIQAESKIKEVNRLYRLGCIGFGECETKTLEIKEGCEKQIQKAKEFYIFG